MEWVTTSSPPILPGTARVQVKAVGLNHLDLWVRNGVPGHRFPLPLIPGCDGAGTIQELGPGAEAKGFQVGDPVIVSPGISCGICEACLGGFDPLCPQYGILGETQDGVCAEEVIVPIANLISKPGNVSFEEGASLGIPFLTAWTMLVRKAELRPGEIVLIQAGGSGVSVAAIQIAKLLGAVVLTTVGDEAKAAKAQALGADHAILYRDKPFREEVKKILKGYGKKGCDVVLDHVGVTTFQESLRCLKWGGKLVTCGATSGSDITLDLKGVFFKNISILGSTMGSKADLIRIIELIGKCKLRPVVDTVYPIQDLPRAFERLEKRDVFGKLVLRS